MYKNNNKITPIDSLHRYYIWANRMRVHFDEILEDDSKDKKIRDIETNMYMSVWYGLLYVVIEGWQKLKLSNKVIDDLLRSDNVQLLKRYRHGTFHFQKRYDDVRFQDFFEKDGTPEWVRSLNKEFGRWFLDELRIVRKK